MTGTVGELRALLAGYSDDMRVSVGRGCCGSHILHGNLETQVCTVGQGPDLDTYEQFYPEFHNPEEDGGPLETILYIS